MPKLTRRFIESLHTDGRDRIIFDSDLHGFAVRVFASGRKSWLIQYRAQKRTRRFTLGDVALYTSLQAREKATTLLMGVKNGENPSQARLEGFAAPSVSDLAERFLNVHCSKKKTYDQDCQMFKNHILPALGKHLVQAVNASDIDRLHASIGEHAKVMANRVVSALNTLFEFAERWDLRPENSNPCRRVVKFREQPRERYLSERELARVGTVMREFEAERGTGWRMVAPLRVLILTGARHGEIRRLRWDEIDEAAGVLRLKDSKSGAKTLQVSPIVMDLIAGLERRSEFVFPRTDGSEPVAQSVTQKVWVKIRARAGLEDVRIHDLRHTFASAGVNSGLSLPIIGKLLGHSRILTTERYSHLSADPVRAGADRIAKKLSAALDGELAEVVPIERGA